jgi:hypothetical protein
LLELFIYQRYSNLYLLTNYTFYLLFNNNYLFLSIIINHINILEENIKIITMKEIIIDDILFINSYYTWKPFQKKYLYIL